MGETLEWDPRIGGGPPRMGGELNPKIGSRTSFWYQFYTIGTNIGLYGLKLSVFTINFRDDSNGSTPAGPRFDQTRSQNLKMFLFFGDKSKSN